MTTGTRDRWENLQAWCTWTCVLASRNVPSSSDCACHSRNSCVHRGRILSLPVGALGDWSCGVAIGFGTRLIVFPGCPRRWLVPLMRRHLPDLASRPGLFEIGVSRFIAPTGIAELQVACCLTASGWSLRPRSDVTLSVGHIAFVGVASFAAAFFAGIGSPGRRGLGADKLDLRSTCIDYYSCGEAVGFGGSQVGKSSLGTSSRDLPGWVRAIAHWFCENWLPLGCDSALRLNSQIANSLHGSSVFSFFLVGGMQRGAGGQIGDLDRRPRMFGFFLHALALRFAQSGQQSFPRRCWFLPSGRPELIPVWCDLATGVRNNLVAFQHIDRHVLAPRYGFSSAG